MNERQLSGLPLDLPSRSCQGSPRGRARALLGVQRRNFNPGADGTVNAYGWDSAGSYATNAGSFA